MDIFANLFLGFSTALTPVNLFYCFIGTFLGTLIGVLPGIGPLATIALLLPITFTLQPTSALIMLAGIYYGAQYGGSTTAILINLPGEASSAVTAIDGYQLARQGKAGTALSIAAIGSFIAGTISTLIIALAGPPLTAAALQFGPWEYFSLIVLGLVSSSALAHGSITKALGMIVMGMLLGLVGTDVYTGGHRFTLAIPDLSDGLELVAVSLGMFGLGEIMHNLSVPQDRTIGTKKVEGLMPTWHDLKVSLPPILRGTFIGSALGILPGGGALLSSFASYAMEKKMSKYPEKFGKGALEGVAGPESANNAGAQTSFIPMLSLGLPSNAVMALMIGALIIQGITPGPNVAKDQPALFWGIIASMWIGNLMLLVLNLPLIGIWVRLLMVPYHVLFPAIIAFSVIGVFTINNNIFDVFVLAVFGVLGYLFMILKCEPAPFILGFILGPMMEVHLRRAMILSNGDPTTFFTHPISATLLAASVIVLAIVTIPSISKKREEIFVEED